MTEKKKVPELRFKEFSGEWEEKKLGDIGRFYKGKALSKKDLSPEGTPCILYGELYTKYNEVTNTVFSRTNYDQNSLFMSEKGDVLLPSSGETALDISTATCLNLDNIALGGDLNVYRCKELNSEFLSYNLNYRQKKNIARLSQGNSVVHLYNSQLSTLKINTPTIQEQQKIADFLSLVDGKLENIQGQIEHLETLKKGFLQKIFSQELRFKDENGNEFPDWEEKMLGEVGVLKGGNGFPEKYQGNSGDIPFIKVSDMNSIGNERYINNSVNNVNLEILNIIKASLVPSKSIIFAKVGAAVYLERKRILQVDSCIDNNMMSFQPHKKYNIIFLYYILQNLKLSRYANVGALPSYNAKDIGNIKVRIPIVHEQQKIADFLSEFDEKIEIERGKLEYWKNIKKGLLQKMFV
jgi:type I restriction enzyme S subunit